MHRVLGWWSIAPYAILAPTGDRFDVLMVPAEWVSTELEAPVFLGPGGAGVLVTPGVGLRADLAAFGATRLADGAAVALPPTGRITWLVAPVEVAWRPGDAVAVQAALYGSATRSSSRRRT